METMADAIERLRAAGYRVDLVAAPGGRLRCTECNEITAAANSTVEDTVRFEGDSNPDDEVILIAILARCGHRGLYSAAYGTDAPAEDAQVLQALAS